MVTRNGFEPLTSSFGVQGRFRCIRARFPRKSVVAGSTLSPLMAWSATHPPAPAAMEMR
jgi:hypothetical protein